MNHKPTKQNIIDSAKSCGIKKDSYYVEKVSKGKYLLILYALGCNSFMSNLERLYKTEIENIYHHPLKINVTSYE